VSVVDLHPTFLEVLDLGGAAEVDGRSLLTEEGASRGVYVESYSGYLNYGWSPLAGWIEGDRKYLHSSAPELYDLGSDPEEQRDLLAEGEPPPVEHRDALERLARLPRLESGAIEVDEERLRELRALGYAAAGGSARALPAPLEPSDRPAPRARADQYAAFSRALGLAQAGRTAQATRLLRETLAENPGNVSAAETLASCLFQEQRFSEVVELLAPRAGEGRYGTHAYLAAAYENLGRDREALTHYRAALRLRPTEPSLADAIARVEARLGG
jgi:tetratricopeptide (TPR) repeat protein